MAEASTGMKETASANVVALKTSEGMEKMFYRVSGTLPGELQGKISKDGFNPVYIGDKKYLPVYIGAKEAEVMLEEKLFSKEGDTLTGFFGNDVIVSKILPITGTDFDNYHVVGRDFKTN
jgi:hypothetical protein